MKNVKETFSKEIAVEKTLEAMKEIVSYFENKGNVVDVLVFTELEARSSGCRGVIRKIDGFSIDARFGIDYKYQRFTRKYDDTSNDFFPVLVMRVYDRKNTYTNLKTSNIAKKVEDSLSSEKSKQARLKKSKEASTLRKEYYNLAKDAVNVTSERSYINEFGTDSGTVTPLSATTVKLVAYLTVEELKAVNELIVKIRK